MNKIEIAFRLSKTVYNLVPHHVAQTIAEISNADFKAYVMTQQKHVETIVVFYAASIAMGLDKEPDTQQVLCAQLRSLVDGFVMTYGMPRGIEFVKNFMKIIAADDFMTLFGEELVAASEMIADRVKSEMATANERFQAEIEDHYAAEQSAALADHANRFPK